jgi:hypothetical protein
MNKKLLMGLAAFCAMGLSAGAWAADAATADEVVAKVKAAAAAVKAGADVPLSRIRQERRQMGVEGHLRVCGVIAPTAS